MFELLKGNQRVLLLFETCFLRCTPDASEVKEKFDYSDIHTIIRFDVNTFSIW